MVIVVKILNCGIVAALFLLHGLSIYILNSSKELNQSRFLVLTLCLSLSDITIGLEFLYHNVLRFMNSQSAPFQYQLMAIRYLACGTVLWSLMQTLLICIERLNATLITKKGILVYLTSNKCVVLCFILSHFIAVLMFGVETIGGPVPTDPKNTATPLIVFSFDILILCITVSIISVYGVVVYRITHAQRNVQTSGLTASQFEKKTRDTKRMRKNVITLGVIIALVLVAFFARSFAVLYLYTVNENEIDDIVFLICNNVFVLVNPLLDPVIYTIRIKNFRDHLRCKCIKNNSVSHSNA
ncbi:Hypothetical predicted protein [Mytilus galloprovincialis]|uniref:G-protein coupled receptors family 1 profile domain-containing protein n=1 Tax=Mytilus galloprovincialis TaxID=29158 RepID=A0A8B6BT28_MYTGA|nr:Hypothetical predicted protein [Mytilus galloprovincialis]